jgi:hypothetical protein
MFLRWCEQHGIISASDVTNQVIQLYQEHLFFHRKIDGHPLSASTAQCPQGVKRTVRNAATAISRRATMFPSSMDNTARIFIASCWATVDSEMAGDRGSGSPSCRLPILRISHRISSFSGRPPGPACIYRNSKMTRTRSPVSIVAQGGRYYPDQRD